MKVNIAIMTIREDEFTAVRSRFQTERQQISGGRTYLIGEVKTEKQTYTIAIARCSEQGNDASQRLAHYIIQNLDPQLILVVGIAGGVPRDEFTMGDVVVSNRIVNPNVDAWHPDGTTDYMTRGGPPHPLIEDIVSLLPGEPRLAGWINTIQLERPTLDLKRENITEDDKWDEKVRKSLNRHFGEEQNRDRPPIFTIGHILSSNHLVKDAARLREILKTHRSILAVEMEVAGVYEAAQGIDHQYPVMAIRGISDIVGLQRDSRWTEYACQTAAAFTYAFIMTDPLEPPPDSASFQKPVAPSEISSAQLLGSESPLDTQHSVRHLSLDEDEAEQADNRFHSITFKQVLFTVAILDFALLFISFFLHATSIITQISIVLSVVIYICGLVPNFLLKPWYWFTFILLSSPLIGGIYFLVDSQLNPTNTTIRWFGFIGFLMLSPIAVALYGLFGPTKTSRRLMEPDLVKRLTLTLSLLGLVLVFVGIGIQWAFSMGFEFMLVGNFLAFVQLIKLKQGKWLVGFIIMSIFTFLIPILFLGIVYGAFGSTDSQDKWEWDMTDS